MLPAQFSAINLHNAALHLVERLEGEKSKNHFFMKNDRRQRAHPPGDIRMENLQPLTYCLTSKEVTSCDYF